ncbi:MAG: CoB--CoM heterodisulfide reductase iron-sulfur subunit B family protein [Candidatus Thermoplasmatota archaeon]|nr:CoB--CoM heterodisulfide reductase iron-sulfur subunit B family protein [Candidatus Thermoplasmatota archaeon]
MKLGLYPGCLMPTEQYGYEISLRAVLPELGIELVDIEDLSCCGEPLKSINQMMTLTLSTRNLAIAKKTGVDLIVPCPMCHLALSEANRVFKDNPEMAKRLNEKLSGEGLDYNGSVKIFHTIDLLHDIVGLEKIKERQTRKLRDRNLATHYGCHIIRPSELGRPVDSENPQKMENILEALGIRSDDYPEKLDCCGGPLLPVHPETSLTKTGQKLKAIQEQEFDGMVLACPWCHKMYDSKQKKAGETVGAKLNVPVLYLTQLVGLAFGMGQEELGLELNLSPVDELFEDMEEVEA